MLARKAGGPFKALLLGPRFCIQGRPRRLTRTSTCAYGAFGLRSSGRRP
jgi:hypothetical protein